MDIDPRLYVDLVPYEGRNPPTPHPFRDAGFDPSFVYKVLGMYNPSETSECYLILSNPNREMWFIPQRHVRAYGLFDGNAMMLPKDQTTVEPSANTLRMIG